MSYLIVVLICLTLLFIVRKRYFDTTDYKSMLDKGAVIIDVRSEKEFLTGHVDNSLNIPLADLPSHFNKLKDKHQHIILCCKSGMRTRAAEILMSSKGYVNIVNGGSWSHLQRKISKNRGNTIYFNR